MVFIYLFLPVPLLGGKYIKMEHFPLEAFDSEFRGVISHVTHAKPGGIWQSCLNFNEGEEMNLYLSYAEDRCWWLRDNINSSGI